MHNTSIGFLGAGHMSRAIIHGILTDEDANITSNQISATCQQQAHADEVAKKYGINAHCDNKSLVESSDFIILGVKPQQMYDVLTEIAKYNLDDKVIITIAAGIKLANYRTVLGEQALLVRAMPNIAASVQAGLTGIYSDTELSAEDETLIETLFNSVGSVAWLDDEVQIDGIIALSGSGLAFILRFMQAMVSAGERFGFEQDELYDIVALTTMGAATLALDGDKEDRDSQENGSEGSSYEKLCQQIAVEGGTTAKGLQQLEDNEIDNIVSDTLLATIQKSRDLGEDLTKDW